VPNRIVREGILTSERVNALTPNAELFYRRLLSVVDDFGRYTANPTLLRASCYPLKLDSVKEDSISKHLAECVGARLIVLYTVADKAYLELQDFRQQVRAKESKYPSPAEQVHSECLADAKQVIADAHLDGGVVEDEDGGGKKRARKRASTPIPENFGVSDRVKAWASEKGYDRLQEHCEAFCRKAKAKGYTYVDWDSAFQEAIREDWAKLRQVNGANGHAAPTVGTPRQRRELGT
jgi:hypothetical protein